MGNMLNGFTLDGGLMSNWDVDAMDCTFKTFDELWCQKGCCLRCTRVVAVDLISSKQKNLLRLFDVNIWRTEFEKSSKFEINILSAAEINRVTNQIPTTNSQITSHHSRHVLCEDMSLLSPLFHVSCPAGALQETSPYRNGSVPSPGVQQASAGGLVATWCELKQGMYITEVHVHRGTCTSVPSANPRLADVFASELRENHQRELGSSLVRQYSRVEVSTEKTRYFSHFATPTWGLMESRPVSDSSLCQLQLTDCITTSLCLLVASIHPWASILQLVPSKNRPRKRVVTLRWSGRKMWGSLVRAGAPLKTI